MKNLIYLFLLLSTIIQAQESGLSPRYLVGGSFSGSSSIDTYPTTSTTISGTTFTSIGGKSSLHRLNFSPYFGWCLNPRSILGASLSTGFTLQRFRSDNRDEDTFREFTYTLGGGFFYRHYLNPSNRLKFYVQPFTSLSVVNGETLQAAPAVEEDRTIRYSVGAEFGFVYSISKKWNLRTNIWGASYSHTSFRTGSEAETQKDNFFSASFSLSRISFGAEYIF